MAFDTPFEAKPDTGSLFATKIKKNEKSPDYFGEVKVNLSDLTNITKNADGTVTVKINGWKRLTKGGSTYLSLAVNRFVPTQQGGSQPQRPKAESFDDEDIPF